MFTGSPADITMPGGSKATKLEPFDVGAKLTELGLDGHFPVEVWPPSAAVREIATWLKARKRLGNSKGYVYHDLKK